MLQRVGMGLLMAGLISLGGAAHADCAAEAAAMHAKLGSAPSRQHEEASLLLEKARIDGEHGREQLCGEALQAAAKLMR